MSSASSLSILEKSISYPGSTSSNTIIGRIVVQVSLARQGKDLVLGPECPKGGSRPPINGDDAAEARRFPVEVNITDHVGNVVAVSTWKRKSRFIGRGSQLTVGVELTSGFETFRFNLCKISHVKNNWKNGPLCGQNQRFTRCNITVFRHYFLNIPLDLWL